MGNDTNQPSTLDSLELLLREGGGAPAISPTLKAGSAVGDRYVIESVIGTGGMGMVYLARDKQLGRSVALKLHRTLAASDRLRREAVAMAKLSHPNVVGVYEVGALDDRSFVAMEYVEGSTLRTWTRAKGRTRGEILDALAAAGAGLAAAHTAGLIHRDVKPENIFVGTDGRVRIGDFGLVRLGDGDGESTALPSDLPLGDGTATGTVMGTPAYMAPEQLEGGVLDARTDQFAFAVVAWEMLAGKRPFEGDTTRELRASIDRGPVAASGKVPSRLRRVLSRGLAPAAERRWPSVHAFITALRAAERRPRVVAASAAVLLVAGGIATYALWPTPDPLVACTDVGSGLASALDYPRTTALVTALATSGTVSAEERTTRVKSAIADARARYAVAASATCHARVTNAWTPELAAASSECLGAGSVLARETLFALPVTAETAADIVQLASTLPTFAPCSDARLLAGAASLVPAGTDPTAVFEARARADVANQLLELGHVKEAEAAHAALAMLPVAAVPAVALRLQLLQIAIDVAHGRVTAVEPRLSKVYFDARTADDGDTMLRAIEELIQFSAVTRRDKDAAKRWADNGISDADREARRAPDLAASVLIAAAEAANERTDNDSVFALADKAQALTTPLTSAMIRAGVESVRHLALGRLGKYEEAIEASDRQIAILESALGTAHPAVAWAYAKRARTMSNAGFTVPTIEAADRARAIVDAENAPDNLLRARAEISISAALLSTLNTSPSAAKYLDRARATLVATFGEDHPDVALVDTNYSILYMDAGELVKARTALDHALAVQEKWLGPTHPEVAATLFNIAVSERKSGNYIGAIATLRRAISINEVSAKGSSRHVSALSVLAVNLNLAKQHEEAIIRADEAVELANPKVDYSSAALAMLEGARARIILKTDLVEAGLMLKSSRQVYDMIEMPARVKEVDGQIEELRKL